MSIWPLKTADQLERMTLGTLALATSNKQSIIFQYEARSIKEKEQSMISVFPFNFINITLGRFDLGPI